MKAAPAVTACVFVATLAHAVPAAAWGLPDEGQLEPLRAASPRAAELLEKGAALAASGAIAEADTLFRQAEVEAPANSLPWRRDCEALTVLGDRKAAISACVNAVERRHSAITIRAMVSAMVDGAPPTTTELFQALKLAERERHLTPWLPTAAATTCDIAMSIGDGVMLERCAGELERTAPDDPVTLRARRLLALRCPPWRFWTGWLAIAGAFAITLGHALLRRLAPRMRKGAIAAAAVAGVLAVPGLARAEDTLQSADKDQLAKEVASHHLGKWPVDDTNPEQHIPSVRERNAEPMQFGYWLQDLTAKASIASRRGDHAASAKFYAALASVVSDRAIAFSKLCDEYEAMGNLPEAINACGYAILREGALVKDYIHFVTLVLSEPGDLSAKEVDALGGVIKHMREDPAGREVVDELECQVGTRTSNVAQLVECTAALAARSPDDAKTISYEWALAVQQGHFDDALQLLARAKTAGVPPENIARMQKRTEDRRLHRAMRLLLGVGAVALLLAGVFFAARQLRRRRAAPPESEPATA